MHIFNRLSPLFLTSVILLVGLNLILPEISPVYAGAIATDQTKVDKSVITGTTNLGIADAVSSLSISSPTLISPANGTSITNARPPLDWSDVGGVISYTLRITGPTSLPELSTQAVPVDITTTHSIYTPTQTLPNGVYTWTVQAHNGAGDVSGFAAPYTFTLQVSWQVFLPIIFKPDPNSICPTTSSAGFEVIPIDGGPSTDHPPPLHGDLNLSLRSYNTTNESKALQDYNGSTDSNSPQLAGLFEPDQFPGISEVYRVNSWDWGCGTHGCAGGPIPNWPVTMLGLPATHGQSIYIPERGPDIYGGVYKAMVLYAEEKRITFVYTRRDTVVGGYTVHLENVCVDPNLLALYQSQTGAEGWHATGNLPALRSNQVLGTAFGEEIQVVIRDGSGSFLDPRSRKDWWKGNQQ